MEKIAGLFQYLAGKQGKRIERVCLNLFILAVLAFSSFIPARWFGLIPDWLSKEELVIYLKVVCLLVVICGLIVVSVLGIRNYVQTLKDVNTKERALYTTSGMLKFVLLPAFIMSAIPVLLDLVVLGLWLGFLCGIIELVILVCVVGHKLLNFFFEEWVPAYISPALERLQKRQGEYRNRFKRKFLSNSNS